MAQKLQLGVIHCSATREGKVISKDTVLQWHLAPHVLTPEEVATALKKTRSKDLQEILKTPGVLRYKQAFHRPNELPNDFIAGVSINQLRGRGWAVPGYSDFISLDGILINLVPYNDDDTVDPWEVTNGVAGINGIARHIMYTGGLDARDNPKDTRTPQQRATLENWVKALIAKYPKIKIAGHNQFANKACPSFDVPAWLTHIGISAKNIYTK